LVDVKVLAAARSMERRRGR